METQAKFHESVRKSLAGRPGDEEHRRPGGKGASHSHEADRNAKVLAIGALARIKDKSLELLDTRLQYGACCTLAEEFTGGSKDEVERIVLNNNGLTDEAMSSLFEGAASLTRFKSLIVRNNGIGLLSFQSLAPCLHKRQPYHLSELCLINCKMASAEARALMDHLLCSNLRRLSLVDANLDEESMKAIVELVARSRCLIELDISWNSLRPVCFAELFEVLRDNRRLVSLNLSWNQI